MLHDSDGPDLHCPLNFRAAFSRAGQEGGTVARASNFKRLTKYKSYVS